MEWKRPTHTSSLKPDFSRQTDHRVHTISLMRGPFQLCDPCYDTIVSEHLVDARNVASDHDAVFDSVCPNCYDRNRPLIDDMLGSSE